MDRRDALKALMGIPAVTAISVLRPAPGDVLVLEIQQDITFATAERIKAQMEQKMPGHKCLVLGGGMTLKVLKAEDVPRVAASLKAEA